MVYTCFHKYTGLARNFPAVAAVFHSTAGTTSSITVRGYLDKS